MNKDKIYLDRNGYKEYLIEIGVLEKKLQDNCKTKSSSYVNAVGDSFEFEDAKRREDAIISLLEAKLNDLNRIVIVERSGDPLLIDIDDTVFLKLRFEDAVETGVYKLIGGKNPNLDTKIKEITLNSPVGSSIYQKKVNDRTSFEVNGCKAEVEILNKIIKEDLDSINSKTKR